MPICSVCNCDRMGWDWKKYGHTCYRCKHFEPYVKISDRKGKNMIIGLNGNVLPGWVVYKKGGQPPTKLHGTLELAKGEAERLATVNLGQTFEVYRVDYTPVGACKVTNCTWTDYTPLIAALL